MHFNTERHNAVCDMNVMLCGMHCVTTVYTHHESYDPVFVEYHHSSPFLELTPLLTAPMFRAKVAVSHSRACVLEERYSHRLCVHMQPRHTATGHVTYVHHITQDPCRRGVGAGHPAHLRVLAVAHGRCHASYCFHWSLIRTCRYAISPSPLFLFFTSFLSHSFLPLSSAPSLLRYHSSSYSISISLLSLPCRAFTVALQSLYRESRASGSIHGYVKAPLL